MALTSLEIKEIARLARLRLSPEEERLYAEQLAQVVEYIDQIGEIERTLGGESPAPAEAGRRLRADEPEDGLEIESFLTNAPASLDRFLLVPQVK